jgi:hypothetical protein
MDPDPNADPDLKIKCPKEVAKQHGRNQGFSYYFCMMIEGSGSGSGTPLSTVDVRKDFSSCR